MHKIENRVTIVLLLSLEYRLVKPIETIKPMFKMQFRAARSVVI